jgi:hypothetical protein
MAGPAGAGKRAQPHPPPYLSVVLGLRAPSAKRGRGAGTQTVAARLCGHVALEAQGDGSIIAWVDGYAVGLGPLSAAAADRAQDLRMGLPLSSFESSDRTIDKEIDRLVRRLARHGLLEYCLQRLRGGEQVVIEP